MSKRSFRLFGVCIAFLLLALFVYSVNAETATTTQPFTIDPPRTVGESIIYQNTDHDSTVQWTVLSGSLQGTGTLTCDGNTGTLTITPSTSCTIAVTMINAFAQVSGIYQTNTIYSYESGVEQTFTWIYTLPTPPSPTPTPAPTALPTFPPSVPQVFLYINYTGHGTINPTAGYHFYAAGTTITLSASPASGYAFNYWLLGDGTNQTTPTITLTMNGNKSALAVFQQIPVINEPTPAPTVQPTPLPTTPPIHPDTLNVLPFWQYFFNGNFIGGLNALYLQAFGLEDIVVGVVLLIIFSPLYIKTKNLLLCSICWILIGGLFIAAVPVLSGLAVILLVLGVASLLYKLVRPN